MLFGIGDVRRITDACEAASRSGLGYFAPGESLTIDSRRVSSLPPLLRLYVGAAEQLVGEVTSTDAVKIHLSSGKLTTLVYDDFYGKAVPLLLERVKIDMPKQRVDYFTYGDEFPPQPLYLKARLLAPDAPGFDEQVAFDEALVSLGRFDLSGFGPSQAELEAGLSEARLEIEGFEFRPRTRGASGS